MGNSLGGRKTTKIMKINGEITKFKTPIKVSDIVKDYPGYVVLDSASVKQYGIRANPLDPFLNLEPKRLYFLVELPKFPQDHQHRAPRRSRSGIQMSAKDRLDCLALSRRSVSEMTTMRPATRVEIDGTHDRSNLDTSGGLRVKVRLLKSEIEKLIRQSRDKDELAEKIMEIYSSKMGKDSLNTDIFQEIQYEKGSLKGKEIVENNNNTTNYFVHALGRSRAGDKEIQYEKGSLKGKEIVENNNNTTNYFVHALGRSRAGDKKTVGFMSTSESEIGLAIA